MNILNSTLHRIPSAARAAGILLAMAATLGLAACSKPVDQVKDVKAQVQMAYGKKDYKTGVAAAEKGLAMARKTLGDKHPDTLYFVQAVSENYLGLGDKKMAAQALNREINLRSVAGQDEQKLQPRRTLAIKMAEESGDKATSRIHAMAISRFLKMDVKKDPQPVYRADTTYPPELYTKGVEGDVQITYSLDDTGAVTDAKIMKSTPPKVFDQVALDSFKKWRFTPMLDEKGFPMPVANRNFTIAFRMPR